MLRTDFVSLTLFKVRKSNEFNKKREILIIFYTNQVGIHDGWLLEEEFHHCTHVLRKKSGDSIMVTDGEGNLYQATINQIFKEKLSFEIVHKDHFTMASPQHCIAISPTKSSDRTEWFLEKAVEMGILHIAFVNFQRTERFKLNESRLFKIALSAMKQSLQYHLPKLYFFGKTNELLEFSMSFESKFITDCQTIPPDNLNKQLDNKEKNIILIGPEGDFTEEEFQMFRKNDFKSLSLGLTRLRTETAGMVAAALLKL